MTLRPKYVGARVRRREDPRLLTGHGSFTADRAVPNALHIAFRRSEHAHARIAGIEATSAAALPGVFAVYTAADLDGLVKPVQATSRMRNYHPTALYRWRARRCATSASRWLRFWQTAAISPRTPWT
jgi:carbon-monoxide dehydrogenase large subunit